MSTATPERERKAVCVAEMRSKTVRKLERGEGRECGADDVGEKIVRNANGNQKHNQCTQANNKVCLEEGDLNLLCCLVENGDLGKLFIELSSEFKHLCGDLP